MRGAASLFKILMFVSYVELSVKYALFVFLLQLNCHVSSTWIQFQLLNKHGARPPKTKNSYRTILIDDSLIHQLKLYRTWCKQTLLLFGKRLSDSDYVYISYQSGTPTGENTLKYSFDRIVKKAGLKTITPHGLRHTHATILIAQRIPVKVIAERLGNTPQMILDLYGHNFKALEEESVVAFEKALNF